MLSYAIGDVHGCLKELNQLVAMIGADAARRQPDTLPELVFLGDLIDRGPDSRGVLERATSPIDGFKTVALAGNHDLMLHSWLFGDKNDRWRAQLTDAYLGIPGNGAPSMLASYGLDGEDFDIHGVPAWAAADLRRELLALMPEPVVNYFRTAPERLYQAIGTRFLAVHAGLDPAMGKDVDDQDEEALTWVRDSFLFSDATFTWQGSPRIVIHGHTPRRDGLPDVKPNRVNVDTFCYHTGALTAAIIEDDWLMGFLSTRDGFVAAPEEAPFVKATA